MTTSLILPVAFDLRSADKFRRDGICLVHENSTTLANRWTFTLNAGRAESMARKKKDFVENLTDRIGRDMGREIGKNPCGCVFGCGILLLILLFLFVAVVSKLI